MPENTEHLLVSQEGYVKTLTLNLPEKKNPVTPSMLSGLATALKESETDGTRVIILTGSGGNFSSGADLSMGGADPRLANVTQYLREFVNPIVLAIRHTDIPVIAKVRGMSVGVACNFALACDLIYASENAVFSEIFVKIGLSSDGGGAYFMPRAIGYQKAFELMTTAAMIKAEEAVALGLINAVLPDADLDATVRKMAEGLANGPYVAIQQTKANLRAGTTLSLAETLDVEAVNQGKCFASKDFMEGVAAFLQKRKPEFKGI
jgi:2-(1,2-epoxy-1,2-dihydrophenyl)acetyl-CoA isomerase